MRDHVKRDDALEKGNAGREETDRHSMSHTATHAKTCGKDGT